MENSWRNTFRLHVWCHQSSGSVSWNSLSSGFWGVISVLSTASSNNLLSSSLGRECISLNSKWESLTSLWSGQFTSGTHPLTHERQLRQEGGIPQSVSLPSNEATFNSSQLLPLHTGDTKHKLGAAEEGRDTGQKTLYYSQSTQSMQIK